MPCSRNTCDNITGTCCRSAQNATGAYSRWALPLLVFLLVSKYPPTLKMSWKRSVKKMFGYRMDDLSLFSKMGRGHYRAFRWLSSNVTCLVGKVDAASVPCATRVIHLFLSPLHTIAEFPKRSLILNLTGTLGLIWNISWNDILPSRAVYFLRYVAGMKKK